MKVLKFFIITVMVFALMMCKPQNEKIAENAQEYDEIFRFIPGNITESLPDNIAMALVKNMGLGINIGNTLDATSGFDNPWWHSGENGWGNPDITKEFIQALKNYGYKSIRLPVTWKDFMGPAPDYLIGECQRPDGCDIGCVNRMDRVEQVVKWILEEDLYCIINLHHDEWTKEAATAEAETMDKFIKVWTQITKRFANISQDKLIFESMNEIGFDTLWNRRGFDGKDEAYRLFNLLNQNFVNTVRASAGNENRFLLIAGYWTNIQDSCDPLFKMPVDTINDRLILSVHYYDPSTFCIAEERNNSWGFRDTWGTFVDYQNLTTEFNKLRNNYLEKGIPVIMGEYGVTLRNKVDEDRVKWMLAVTQTCLNYGICPMMWDTGWVIDRDIGGEISRFPPYVMRDSLKKVLAALRYY